MFEIDIIFFIHSDVKVTILKNWTFYSKYIYFDSWKLLWTNYDILKFSKENYCLAPLL